MINICWNFFGFRNSKEKLCVSWALSLIECPYRYALNERERPLDTYFFNKLLENKKPAQFLLHQHLLIHQPNQKPEWGVVKADDSFIICFGFTIIPRAAAAFFQEGAGAIFGEENAGSVDGAAHEDMPALHFFA